MRALLAQVSTIQHKMMLGVLDPMRMRDGYAGQKLGYAE